MKRLTESQKRSLLGDHRIDGHKPVAEREHFCDSEEDIQQCLHCTQPECRGCGEKKRKKRKEDNNNGQQ